MTDFELQCKFLSEILDQKQDALTCILNITENQRSLLETGLQEPDLKDMYTGMIAEKQTLIDTVNNCDKLFESHFRAIRDAFEDKAPQYKSILESIQAQIKSVVSLDVRIRAAELQQKQPKPKPQPSSGQSRILAQKYAKHKKL
jgi:hypothetical protein